MAPKAPPIEPALYACNGKPTADENRGRAVRPTLVGLPSKRR